MGDMTGLAPFAMMGFGALVGLLIVFLMLIASAWFDIPTWAFIAPVLAFVAIGGVFGWVVER